MKIPINPFNVSDSISHIFPGRNLPISIAMLIHNSSKVSSKNMPRRVFEWKTCETIHRSSWTAAGTGGHGVVPRSDVFSPYKQQGVSSNFDNVIPWENSIDNDEKKVVND